MLLLGYFSSKCFSSDPTLFMALKRERWSLLTEIIKIFVLVCVCFRSALKIMQLSHGLTCFGHLSFN